MNHRIASGRPWRRALTASFAAGLLTAGILAAPALAQQQQKPAQKPAAQKTASKPTLDPNVRAAALELERTLGTRVKILGNGRRGKIEIHYFSAEDLNRIYDLIVRQ